MYCTQTQDADESIDAEMHLLDSLFIESMDAEVHLFRFITHE